jgi:hypothetical protein
MLVMSYYRFSQTGRVEIEGLDMINKMICVCVNHIYDGMSIIRQDTNSTQKLKLPPQDL